MGVPGPTWVSSRFFSADNTSASVVSLTQAMRNLSVVMPRCLASSSCAGLTRASIFFARKFLRRSMDCGVKPGNDDLNFKLSAYGDKPAHDERSYQLSSPVGTFLFSL